MSFVTTMRVLVSVITISFALSVGAELQPPTPTLPKKSETPQGKAAKNQQRSTVDQRGTGTSPPVVEATPPKKTHPPADGNPYKHYHEASPDWWIVVPTILLTIFTGGLFFYAAFQSNATQRSLAISKRAADAAKISADAAILPAMPFLHPKLVELSLYPDGDHVPKVGIEFHNIGRTPAILDKVGARLILIKDDGLQDHPPPPIEEIDAVERSDVIPPDQFKNPKPDWSLGRKLSANEVAGLKADALPYVRFYVMGYVIYHDIFGFRTTQRFCLKTRQHGFQAMRGGDAHNEIKREKQPAGEAPGRTADA